MAAGCDRFGLLDTGLPLLRDLIHERTGLFYDNGRYETLTDRIAPLVLERGFRSFLDFYYLLKYDDQAAAGEWQRVLSVLSVPETYFWREMDQIDALVGHIIPALARGRSDRPIRIWSVPCATGEEPLTIAMALSEANWFDRVPIEIHASDGSPVAIEKARSGEYRDRAFRSLPPALREKYFVAAGRGFRPVPELAERIASWSVVNLMAREEVAPCADAPVIFCRNAFIYFSPQSVRRVVDLFADLMPSPGYLCVGASESLLSITDRFRLEDIGRAFIYVKR